MRKSKLTSPKRAPDNSEFAAGVPPSSGNGKGKRSSHRNRNRNNNNQKSKAFTIKDPPNQGNAPKEAPKGTPGNHHPTATAPSASSQFPTGTPVRQQASARHPDHQSPPGTQSPEPGTHSPAPTMSPDPAQAPDEGPEQVTMDSSSSTHPTSVSTPPTRHPPSLPPHLNRVSQEFDRKMTVAEKQAYDRRLLEQQEDVSFGSSPAPTETQLSPEPPKATAPSPDPYANGDTSAQPWRIEDLNSDWRREEMFLDPEDYDEETPASGKESPIIPTVFKLVTTNPEFTNGDITKGYRMFEDVTSVTFCEITVKTRAAKSMSHQGKGLATAINPLGTILSAANLSPVLYPLSIEHHDMGPAMFPLSLSFDEQKFYFSRTLPVDPEGFVRKLRFGVLLGLKGTFAAAKAALKAAFDDPESEGSIDIWADPLQLQQTTPVCWMMFSGMEMFGVNWKEMFEPILCRKIGYNFRKIFGLNVEYDGEGRESKPRPTLHLYAEAYQKETILDRLQELYSSFDNSSAWPMGVFLVPLPILDPYADNEQITQMKDLAKRHHKWQIKHNRKQQSGVQYQNLHSPLPKANYMTLYQLLMAVKVSVPPGPGLPPCEVNLFSFVEPVRRGGYTYTDGVLFHYSPVVRKQASRLILNIVAWFRHTHPTLRELEGRLFNERIRNRANGVEWDPIRFTAIQPSTRAVNSAVRSLSGGAGLLFDFSEMEPSVPPTSAISVADRSDAEYRFDDANTVMIGALVNQAGQHDPTSGAFNKHVPPSEILREPLRGVAFGPNSTHEVPANDPSRIPVSDASVSGNTAASTRQRVKEQEARIQAQEEEIQALKEAFAELRGNAPKRPPPPQAAGRTDNPSSEDSQPDGKSVGGHQ